MKTTNTKKTLWGVAIYFALSFFVLGASAMMHYFVYPKFDKVHEHIADFMKVFNSRVIFLFYFPSVLLLISSISLFWFAPKGFTKLFGYAIITLSAFSVITIFFILIPLQNSFSPTTGFVETDYNNLLSYSLMFQLIPIVVQSVLTFFILNNFLSNTKQFSRWIFIILISLAFYTAGSDFVEKLINYPLWLTVGIKEWLIFRRGGNLFSFILVYLLPAFLPLLLIMLMFWFRPKSIKQKFIFLYLGLYLFISVISSTYFVPKIQFQLNTAYSITLIKELIKMDFPLRFFPALLIYGLAIFMFIKVGKNQIQETK